MIYLKSMADSNRSPVKIEMRLHSSEDGRKSKEISLLSRGESRKVLICVIQGNGK